MSRFVVTARKDGRGLVRPFIDGKTHAYEDFWLHGVLKDGEDSPLEVTKDGRVYIPRAIMEEFGTLLSNGRRALVLETGATHIDGEFISGADILQSPSITDFLRTAKTGDRVPDSVVGKNIDELKILKPRDGVDLYKS